jgi:hypothetical protein
MFTHSVGNLNDAAYRVATVPLGRSYVQAVSAKEMKVSGRKQSELTIEKNHGSSIKPSLQSTGRSRAKKDAALGLMAWVLPNE